MNKKSLLAFFIIFVLTANPVLADGGFFPKYDFSDIYEPEQTGIIVFEDGKQKLYLWVSYEGIADEFSWVIPVPNMPELEESTLLPFYELSDLTRREQVELYNMMTGTMTARNLGSADLGVSVEREEQVGIYDATILSAQDPVSLVDWLRENNYVVREGSEEIFRHYTDEDWYYVALKINSSRMSQGNIHPIMMKFETEKPIYPLKITSLNPGKTEIVLYIISSNRMKPDNRNFKLEYANNINEQALNRTHHWLISYNYYYSRSSINFEDIIIRDQRANPTINRDFSLARHLPENAQITKYSAVLSQRQMKDDITFNSANIKNYVRKEYGERFYNSLIILIISPIFFAPFLAIPFFIIILIISLLYNQLRIVKNNQIYKMKIVHVIIYSFLVPVIPQWALGVYATFSKSDSALILIVLIIGTVLLSLAAMHYVNVLIKFKKNKLQENKIVKK